MDEERLSVYEPHRHDKTKKSKEENRAKRRLMLAFYMSK